MKRPIALVLAGLLAGAAMPAPASQSAAQPAAQPAYDIVIRGGRVLDGAGNPWITADVAVQGGRIARIGTVEGRGKQEIDARGRYVSPGFVDMMDQSGRTLLRDGTAANKLRMGVTTLIAGEGGTPVPAAEIAGYFSTLERQGIAVNFGTYYSAVHARVKVMGDGAGAPSEAQLRAMEDEVRTAMRAGVFGVSSALIYHPASFQSTDDLARLAAIPGRCGGFYATHMRDESDKLIAAIDEAVTIGERSGAKVEIFHIKAAYAPLWGKLMPQAVARIEAARDRGLDIGANIYPYRAGGTGLEVTIPTHIFAKGRAAAHAALRDPAVRAQLKKELAAGPQPDWSNLVHASGGWGNVVLANSYSEDYKRFHGKSFAQIGKELGKDPADAAWDIWLAALPARASALYFMMDEGDIDLAMRQPWVSVGTDAGASDSTADPEEEALVHPRTNGTFPRILAEYVAARRVLTLPDAIRKMTSWPAQRLGLADRGLLREGMRADIVVFDLARVKDRATFEAPTAAPEGIGEVIVNGVVALAKGQPTGSRSGAVLRHACPGV
jgi:N-acyl-D-amino-acid deacylase